MRNYLRCTAVFVALLGGAAHAAPSQPPGAARSTETASRLAAAPGDDGARISRPDGDRGDRGDRKADSLTADEISAAMAPHAPQIRRCYREELGDTRVSRVELTVVITYKGRVRSTKASAPGLAEGSAKKMATCMRQALANARFPERRNDTMAVLPYYFQKTDAPQAGPQMSCWNRKGCS